MLKTLNKDIIGKDERINIVKDLEQKIRQLENGLEKTILKTLEPTPVHQFNKGTQKQKNLKYKETE